MPEWLQSRCLPLVFVTTLLVYGSCPAWAESTPGARLLQKKAATIYNLCKFIHWPDTADSTTDFNICVPAGSDIYQKLGTFEKHTVAGRPVRAMEIGADVNRLEQCRVLFISADPDSTITLDQLIVLAAQYPLLTISDIAGFTDHNGMIELIQVGDRVRFAINVSAARQAGLLIAAPLLSIAAKVQLGVNDAGK